MESVEQFLNHVLVIRLFIPVELTCFQLHNLSIKTKLKWLSQSSIPYETF